MNIQLPASSKFSNFSTESGNVSRGCGFLSWEGRDQDLWLLKQLESVGRGIRGEGIAQAGTAIVHMGVSLESEAGRGRAIHMSQSTARLEWNTGTTYVEVQGSWKALDFCQNGEILTVY